MGYLQVFCGFPQFVHANSGKIDEKSPTFPSSFIPIHHSQYPATGLHLTCAVDKSALKYIRVPGIVVNIPVLFFASSIFNLVMTIFHVFSRTLYRIGCGNTLNVPYVLLFTFRDINHACMRMQFEEVWENTWMDNCQGPGLSE